MVWRGSRPLQEMYFIALYPNLVLPAAAGAAGGLALLAEAVRAVDRLVAARHERHLGLPAARGARGAVHLALAAAVAATAAVAAAVVVAAIAVAAAVAAASAAARLASLPAGWAARRLIGE